MCQNDTRLNYYIQFNLTLNKFCENIKMKNRDPKNLWYNPKLYRSKKITTITHMTHQDI